ncbi:MAG TPA: hypothetical protein VFC63_02475 [Blastocatellia bacterium]|nr:hypothetical protein [Blastocatellia bacterium]
MTRSNLSVRIALGIVCLLMAGMLSGCLVGSSDDPKPADSKVENSPVFNKVRKDSAMGALNAIRTAEISYMSESGSYGTFDQLVAHQFLDSRFSGDKPVIQGYAFTVRAGSGGFVVNADPKEGDGRHFYLNQDNIIRFNDQRSAGSSDPVLTSY